MAFVPYQGMPSGWMRQIIGASPSRPAFRIPSGCVAHFWDNEKKCLVTRFLGEVSVRVPFVFRAAASGSSESTFEGDEVAAPSANNSQNDRSVKNVRVLCNTRTYGPTGPLLPINTLSK